MKRSKLAKHTHRTPGIRSRVMLYLGAFVVFVLVLLWLMQIVWLDDIYRWDKTRQIRQASDAVASNLDSGKGIPPEELPRIWHRYYRAHESHCRAVIGSGLGLSIVQSILEKHGAKYGVDSAVDQGSTFWFELPIIEKPEV